MVDDQLQDVPSPEAIEALRSLPLAWYAAHARTLPWRGCRDPYGIVVAEMMLQQTGVDRVAPRWVRFLERFPTWSALAEAPVAEVIREWKGLGYNRRAVNLHRLARQVVGELRGVLPATRAELIALPGIGPYTAGAILAFVHGQDVAAIDVNVKRVVGRAVFGDDGAQLDRIGSIANRCVPSGRGADWSQALMDLAALHCTARRPTCLVCPLLDACRYARDAPRPARRRVAETRTPYHASTRFLRGRLVDALRRLGPGEQLSLTDASALLGQAGRSDLEAVMLMRGLVRDGLAAEHAGPAFSLP